MSANLKTKTTRNEIMTVNIEMVKCACADCVCIVGTDNAVQTDGRMFCGDNCATHHEEKAGCDHADCPCHG